MHGGGAEDPGDGRQQPELHAPGQVEPRQPEVEEVLPELEVPRLDPDQLLEHRPERTRAHVPEGLIERQVEQLVQDQPPRQPGVGAVRRLHDSHYSIGTMPSCARCPR
jgi:hypothetical protein